MNNGIVISMDKTAITIRMSEELLLALQEVATREGLPVSKLVLTSLAEKYPELVPLILKH